MAVAASNPASCVPFRMRRHHVGQDHRLDPQTTPNNYPTPARAAHGSIASASPRSSASTASSTITIRAAVSAQADCASAAPGSPLREIIDTAQCRVERHAAERGRPGPETTTPPADRSGAAFDNDTSTGFPIQSFKAAGQPAPSSKPVRPAVAELPRARILRLPWAHRIGLHRVHPDTEPRTRSRCGTSPGRRHPGSFRTVRPRPEGCRGCRVRRESSLPAQGRVPGRRYHRLPDNGPGPARVEEHRVLGRHHHVAAGQATTARPGAETDWLFARVGGKDAPGVGAMPRSSGWGGAGRRR